MSGSEPSEAWTGDPQSPVRSADRLRRRRRANRRGASGRGEGSGGDQRQREDFGARLAAALAHLRALREPALRRLFLAQLTSLSGDFIIIAALPFAVFAIGGSSTQVALAFGVSGIVEVGLVLFAGAIGDRFTRRSVMVCADLARLGSQAILAALLIAGEAHYWQLLAVQLIQGAGAAFFNPSMSGLVPEVVPESRLEDANALLTIAFSTGAMLGPALAGTLIALGGTGSAFAVDAVTFGASAALLASIRVASAPAAEGSMVASLREGWGEFRRQRWLWMVVLEFSLLNALVFGPFQVLGASAAHESLGGAGAWTAILTASGTGQLLGGVIALLWRPRRPLFTSIALLATWAAPLALLALAAPLTTIVVAAFLAGTTIGLFIPIFHTTMQTKVAINQISRVSSYDWLGSLGLLPFGYAIAAGSRALIGGDATLLAAAFVVLIATAVTVPQPAIRAILRREPPPQLVLAAARAGASQ